MASGRDEGAPRKRGGQPKDPATRKSQNLTFRVRDGLRAKLGQAASQTSRSISEEIERRLERSFYEEDRLTEVFGSRQAFAIMRLLASNIEPMMNIRDREADWTTDPYLFDQVVKAFNLTLDMIRPPGEAPKGDDALDHGGAYQGRWRAAEMLREVKQADLTVPLSDLTPDKRVATVLKQDLGEIAERAELPYRTIAEVPEELWQAARAKGISRTEEIGRRQAATAEPGSKPRGKRK